MLSSDERVSKCCLSLFFSISTACECNLHSNSCTFSQHLYLLSKKVSGGVCEDCRHHTTGEKCHQCMEGFYRDWTKPISHPRVCLSECFLFQCPFMQSLRFLKCSLYDLLRQFIARSRRSSVYFCSLRLISTDSTSFGESGIIAWCLLGVRDWLYTTFQFPIRLRWFHKTWHKLCLWNLGSNTDRLRHKRPFF